MSDYQHYIRINETGTIVHGFSSAFEQPQEGDICINEDAPRHFSQTLIDNRGIYLFKYVNGQGMSRTSQEIDEDIALIPITKSTEQKIAELEQLVADLASLQLGV